VLNSWSPRLDNPTLHKSSITDWCVLTVCFYIQGNVFPCLLRIWPHFHKSSHKLNLWILSQLHSSCPLNNIQCNRSYRASDKHPKIIHFYRKFKFLHQIPMKIDHWLELSWKDHYNEWSLHWVWGRNQDFSILNTHVICGPELLVKTHYLLVSRAPDKHA